MGKKKGNTVIIMLAFVFLISSFLLCHVILNKLTTNKLSNYINESDFERQLEIRAYEFYFTYEDESNQFSRLNNVIVYNEDPSIKFYIFDENGIFYIRKEEEK